MDKLMIYALEFYANPDNWKWVAKSTDTDFILDCGSEVQRDFGERAREALQRSKQSMPMPDAEAVRTYWDEAKQPEIKTPIKCPICVSESYPNHLVYCKHSPVQRPSQNPEVNYLPNFLEAMKVDLAIRQYSCDHRYDAAIGNGEICLDCAYSSKT